MFEKLIILQTALFMLGDLAKSDQAEENLYWDLMDNYEKHVRPSSSYVNNATKINFQFFLNMIVDLDEKNQILTTRSWLNITWNDERLRWDPKNHSDIKLTQFPMKALWKPDIVLTNNAFSYWGESMFSTDFVVHSNGLIVWQTLTIFRSSCSIDMRHFPFDSQECALNFTSWSHNSEEVRISLASNDTFLLYYKKNQEFKITEITAYEHEAFTYTAIDKTWPLVSVTIKIKRKPFFYVFNHMMPSILTSLMALIGFLIPHNSGEKVTMYTTMMLSMSVYLKTITKHQPPTSEASVVALFYVVSLITVSCITVMNIWTMNLNDKGWRTQSGPSNWVKKWVLGYLAWFLRIEAPSYRELPMNTDREAEAEKFIHLTENLNFIDESTKSAVSSSESESTKMSPKKRGQQHLLMGNNDISSSRDNFVQKLHEVDADSSQWSPCSGHSLTVRYPKINAEFFPLIVELERVMGDVLDKVWLEMDKSEHLRRIHDDQVYQIWEWRAVALVIDRFLLAVFLLATILASILIFIQPALLKDGHA